MTDLEMVKMMLERAQVPYSAAAVADVSETGHSARLPEGSHVVTVPANQSYNVAVEEILGDVMDPPGTVTLLASEQPYPGGYSGFWSELIFDADGALIAVWAWE